MSLFGPPNVEKLKAKGDIKGMIKALGYAKDPDVSQGASLALVELGDVTVEPLIAALEHKNDAVRQAAADTLVKFGGKGIVPLIAALKDWKVQDAAVKALVKVSEPEVELLIERLVAAFLVEGDDIEGEISVLIKIGTPSVEKLLDILTDKTLSICKTKSKIMSLYPSAPKVFPYFAELLLSRGGFYKDNLNIRGFAAAVLGRIGDARAVEPLIATLQDENEFVRGATAGALFAIGDDRALEPLLTYLKDEDLVATIADRGVWEFIGDGRGVKLLLHELITAVNKKEIQRTFELLGWGSRVEQ